ncbi:unnamed protein product, partial [Porites lobata]
TLAICKQCRTRLSIQREDDEVTLMAPKSQDETRGDKDCEEPESTSSSPGEPRLDVQADQLSQSMGQLFIEQETSLYLPEDTDNSSESSGAEDQRTVGAQRTKLNEFLSTCNVGSTVGVYKKKWQDTSLRTRRSRVSKAKESIVAALNVIAPGDAGPLWEALKESKSVEKALGIAEESQSDRKYLEALAETYNNASSWATRRQILSVMADLTSLEKIQAYIPSITEFKFAIARKHKIEYGRGVPLPLKKSPRMRVDTIQLDHFISFITSPHIIQDLPFGQRYLHLSTGKVLETPNVIRNMIPQRIVKQYMQYCYETNFKPFSPSTILRILSCCSATVRKSLQGLDYIAAEGAKGFDDLHRILDRLGEYGLRRDLVSHCQKSLKEAKHYLKAEYKAHVAESVTNADHCSTYALSDSKEDPFKSTCNHSHDKRCMQCETLKDVLEKVEYCFVDCEVSPEELDDLTYSCRQAVDSIKGWKAHQLRIPDYSQPPGFECQFSSGDFSEVPQAVDKQKPSFQETGEQHPDEKEEDRDLSAMFSCPHEGCVKMYQRHYALENHLLYGQCEFLPVRESLMDKAKVLYHDKLLREASNLPSVKAESSQCPVTTEVLPQGWALRSARKATRFSDSQRQYLDGKFNVGQATGVKLDPVDVARDMRYARNQEGEKLFTVSEFLTEQQIQSYFSRRASKLRHSHSEDPESDQDEDIMAAEEEIAHENVRAVVLEEVGIRHPIVFDTFNLCDMHKTGKLRHLSVSMLRSICEHFDIEVMNIKGRRKAPYLSLLGELLVACSCHNS